MRKPIIGIACEFEEWITPEGRDRSYTKLYHHYYHAILGAGATPVLFPVLHQPEEVLPMLAIVDGIMLTGGDDYPPGNSKEKLHPRTRLTTPWRTEQDLFLARYLLEHESKPVLAICGGLQALALADGGNIIQDIPSEWENPLEHSRKDHSNHRLKWERGTRLEKILGPEAGEKIEVNSYHHQAVRSFGKNLKASAWTYDGIIEAGEFKNSTRYCIGVQWHPELTPQNKTSIKLFKSFVEACRKSKSRHAK